MQNLSRLVTLLAALAAATALAGAGAAQRTATPQIVLDLNAAGTLEIDVQGGPTIRPAGPATSIAPGHYQVVVNNDQPDYTDGVHLFRFSGPGINLQTDMGAGDNKTEAYDAVLAANATYVFQDDHNPGLARVSVSTGSAASGSTGTTGTTTTGSTSGGTSNTSVIGSKAVPFRGALSATVAADGAVTITRAGKKVTTLKAGRYAVTVVDRGADSGLSLQQAGKKAIVLTEPTFLGRRTTTVSLTAGSWSCFSGTARKQSFVVVS